MGAARTFSSHLASCVVLLSLAGSAVADVEEELAAAETAWLATYTENDPEAMAGFLADGFTITFPDGRVDLRADVIGGLDPSRGTDDSPHFTRDRVIRVLGSTAILSGIYVDPSDDADRPDLQWRYTDTWMLIDGRWRVVASHLSYLKPPPCS